MASYATPAQLLARKDVRLIGALVTDGSVTIDPTSLLSDPNLQAALDDASGEIESALLRGKRYTVAQLEALTGNSANNLVRICCDIAFANLWERRPLYDDPRFDQALLARREHLRRLATGEEIFDVPAVVEAGLPKITGPTRVTRRDLNLISGRARGRFYPAEALPDNR